MRDRLDTFDMNEAGVGGDIPPSQYQQYGEQNTENHEALGAALFDGINRQEILFTVGKLLELGVFCRLLAGLGVQLGFLGFFIFVVGLG